MRRKNPVDLLIKFQHKETLTKRERDTLWTFLDEYVRRCEKNHFGTFDRYGTHDDVHTERVLFLCDMLRSYRDVVYTEHPYTNELGKTKKAKACSLRSELKHPNLILTNFRRGFSNVETIFRLRYLGVSTNKWGCFDINTNYRDLTLFSDIFKRIRTVQHPTFKTVYASWLSDNPKATIYRQEQYKDFLSRALYFVRYGCTVPLTDENGTDRLSYNDVTEVFA